jgi:outer membrane immunogenic protein
MVSANVTLSRMVQSLGSGVFCNEENLAGFRRRHCFCDFSVRSINDFLASATARLGYSFVDRWLFYVKGGAAWTNEKVDDAFTTVGGIAVDPSTSSTRTGWTTGTGAEWAFAPNWSATLEYDYHDFGSKGLSLTGPNATVTISSFKDTIHTVTAGVNYRF